MITVNAKDFAKNVGYPEMPEKFVEKMITFVGNPNIIKKAHERRPFAFTDIIYDDSKMEIINDAMQKMSWFLDGYQTSVGWQLSYQTWYNNYKTTDFDNVEQEEWFRRGYEQQQTIFSLIANEK